MPTLEKQIGDGDYFGESKKMTVADVVYFTEINQIQTIIGRDIDKDITPKLHRWFKLCLEHSFLKEESKKLEERFAFKPTAQ